MLFVHTIFQPPLCFQVWMPGLTGPIRCFQVQMPGLTGPIQFSGGRRTRLKLDLMKLTSAGMKKVGWWSVKTGVNVTDSSAFYGTGLPNVTLLVSTIQVRSEHTSSLPTFCHATLACSFSIIYLTCP